MRARRLGTATLLVAVLAAGSGACGTDDAPGPSRPTPSLSAADRACRESWSRLGDEARRKSRAGVSLRAAFSGRWNSIAAGIDYYAQTATAEQCGRLLEARRTRVRRTSAVITRAVPYDAGQRGALARVGRAADRALPGGSKEPKDVVAAYATLAKQTPVAAEDLRPAYRELARAEPTDAKAVALGLSDVRLLAETSDAYQACTAALKVVAAWHASLVRRR